MLSRCLARRFFGSEKYAEAEPLPLARHAEQIDMKASTSLSRKRVIEALERLVKLYEDVAKPDEATKWRLELAAMKAAQKAATAEPAKSP